MVIFNSYVKLPEGNCWVGNLRYTKKKNTYTLRSLFDPYISGTTTKPLFGRFWWLHRLCKNSSCSMSLLHVPTWDHGLLQNVAKVNPMCFQYPMILTEMSGPRSPKHFGKQKNNSWSNNYPKWLSFQQLSNNIPTVGLCFLEWCWTPHDNARCWAIFWGTNTPGSTAEEIIGRAEILGESNIYGPYNPNSGWIKYMDMILVISHLYNCWLCIH